MLNKQEGIDFCFPLFRSTLIIPVLETLSLAENEVLLTEGVSPFRSV